MELQNTGISKIIMALSFSQAETLFKQDRLNDLCMDSGGRRFLKLRSMSRTEYLRHLFQYAEISQPDVNARELFKVAFESNIPIKTIEACIREIYREGYEQRRAREDDLLNQLYRVQEFNWGGLYQNSLERTIVDNYVKKITDYETLCQCIKNELFVSMRGYVICSWYNHWTSIIIEDIFKGHPNVLPAVGLVKKIDFFVRDVPFDLKVTYLPEDYLAQKRRAAKQRPEITLLKQAIRLYNLPVPGDLVSSDLLQDLWTKVADHPSHDCQELISQILDFRNSVVNEIERDPDDLIRWLYENQGERRFDASNRLFVILVDQRNYFESWKLKRAKSLMETKIHKYLDNCDSSPGRRITFEWKGNNYTTISDVLVIRQSQQLTGG